MSEDFLNELIKVLNNFDADYVKGDFKIEKNGERYEFEYQLSHIEPVTINREDE